MTPKRSHQQQTTRQSDVGENETLLRNMAMHVIWHQSWLYSQVSGFGGHSNIVSIV